MKLVTMDVHSDMCTAGIYHGKGSDVHEIGTRVIPTSIPQLKAFLKGLSGQHVLVIEEGPLAPWLKRHLAHLVRRFVVTNPRRNALIFANGDKDDFKDLADLATIYVNKSYKEVYHTDNKQRQQLKDQVLHYHDHTQTIASVKSKIKAVYRAYGIRVKGDSLYSPGQRAYWTDKLSAETSPRIIMDLYDLLQALEQIQEGILKRLRKFSKPFEIVKRFQEVPAIGPVTAVSFFAIIDTPWRFKSLESIYKYCGLAVVNKSSNGKWLSRPGLNKDCNHIMKSLMLRAGHNVIFSKSILNTYYQHHLKRGLTAAAAKNHTARKIVQTMISMWKHDTHFDPERIMK